MERGFGGRTGPTGEFIIPPAKKTFTHFSLLERPQQEGESMARGKERMVRCEKCGKEVRRDKAVYIEKNVFSVPIDKKDVTEPDYYKRSFFREVAYCPGCGKHLRIYEKKIRQNIRDQERADKRQFMGPSQRRPFRRWSESDAGKGTGTGVAAEKPKVVESKVVSEMDAGSAEITESEIPPEAAEKDAVNAEQENKASDEAK